MSMGKVILIIAAYALMLSCTASKDTLVRDQNNSVKHPLSSKFEELYKYDFELKKVNLLFDNETYYLANSEENDLMFGLELTKDGKISEKSEDIITICQLKYKNKFKDYLLYYLDSLKKNNDNISFEMYKNNKSSFTNEYILNISILNLKKKIYEQCIIRLFADNDSIIHSYAYSKRHLLSYITNDENSLTNKNEFTKVDNSKKIPTWLVGVQNMEFKMFP